MHELSLVQELLGQVMAVAKEHNAKRVTRVSVEIGPFAGVVLDSFDFAFEALKGESVLLEGASLHIETPPAIYRCTHCGATTQESVEGFEESPLSARDFFQRGRCPKCNKGELYPVGGDEILLKQIELE
ncbi:MAG: hydrogenase maturation nickel metallochaperone HypA [Thermodesulfobacteria bacterium]|nr:hydrogenase maturation nickel metallochaperone HypA [Thermodesulfobacteriota bacterium]